MPIRVTPEPDPGPPAPACRAKYPFLKPIDAVVDDHDVAPASHHAHRSGEVETAAAADDRQNRAAVVRNGD